LPRWCRSARRARPSTAALLVLLGLALASAVIFATDAAFHRV
jgi:hypothetical protein